MKFFADFFSLFFLHLDAGFPEKLLLRPALLSQFSLGFDF